MHSFTCSTYRPVDAEQTSCRACHISQVTEQTPWQLVRKRNATYSLSLPAIRFRSTYEPRENLKTTVCSNGEGKQT
jgi:hypothetical protein